MELKESEKAVWEMKKEGSMKVPAFIIANNRLVDGMKKDKTMEQLRNVASLDGIVKQAILLPDGHQGYGFPIGGVAAFDAETGLVSPGGVGYDINCGVRLLKTDLTPDTVRPKIRELCDKLFKNVPSGVGSESKLRISHEELDEAVIKGVDWAIDKGYGNKEDKEHCEEYGSMKGADPTKVSPTAKKRGKSQFGTLGAGNHFLEIQVIDKVFNPEIAKAFGLEEGKITTMVHCGSRGYGHQICSDSIPQLLNNAQRTNLWLPDKELVYAPMQSTEAQNYMAAMKCAVNFAFTNRHIIGHWVRETFDDVFGSGTSDKMNLLYDVAHNIAKIEEHEVEGEKRKLIVHRKGATRAFPAGRPELPESYKSIGQPVLIPGSMGTASYVLVGKQKGLEVSWGSTCHGESNICQGNQAKSGC
jgi:tRNA-splicing ligase RtcB